MDGIPSCFEGHRVAGYVAPSQGVHHADIVFKSGAIAGLLLVGLSGCGGGINDPGTTPVAVVQPPIETFGGPVVDTQGNLAAFQAFDRHLITSSKALADAAQQTARAPWLQDHSGRKARGRDSRETCSRRACVAR